VNPEFFWHSPLFLFAFSMNFKTYSLRFLAQRFEREKTSQCRDSCQLTRFLSPAPFPASPSPPFTLSWILQLIWNHKQGPCSSPCLGKICGASKIKLKKVNKKRTVTVRRVIIFLNISRGPLLICLQCCLHQYKTLKAVATAKVALVLLTPAKNLKKVFSGFLVVSPLFNHFLG
jgi:hypothetical protein